MGAIFRNPTGNVTIQEVNDGDTSLVSKPSLGFFNNGIGHSIPISTQLNVAKYITIQPSFNFKEYWYFKTRDYSYHPDSRKVGYTERPGFASARDFNFSVGTSTRIYGLFGGGGKKQTTVRHTVTPNVAYTFRPDFSESRWGFYQEIQIDSTGKTNRFNRFANGIQGAPPRGEQQEISFGLNNMLELKYRTKVAEGDTTEKKDPYTRLTLLDAFAVNGRYNFAAADSLYFSPFSFIARTNFLNNKFNFVVNGALDPYAVNQFGRRIPTYRYETTGRLARLSTFGVPLERHWPQRRVLS